MPVDPPKVPPSQGHAMAVEELEDLNRHLSAVLDPVADLGGGESAIGDCLRQIGDDRRHLPHRGPKEEMVVGDLVG